MPLFCAEAHMHLILSPSLPLFSHSDEEPFSRFLFKMDELPPKETNDDDILPILNETLENRDDNDDDDGSSASSQHGDNREEDPQGSKQLKAKRSRVATDIEGGEENDTNDTITLGSESGVR